MLVVASVGGAVFAQQDAETPVEAVPKVGLEEIAKLPRLGPSEMLSTSGERIAFISAQVGEVKQRLALAQKEKDIVRFNCLNEISARMKAYFTAAEERMQRLRDAAARTAHDEMYQLYAEILIYTQKVEYLSGEARSCAGAGDVVGTTTVEVVAPDRKVGEKPDTTDVTALPRPDRPDIRPPRPASPWK